MHSLVVRVVSASSVLATACLLAFLPLARSGQERSIAPGAGGGASEVRSLVLEGFVLDVDGNSASGVVVVSGAGGQAETDAAGR